MTHRELLLEEIKHKVKDEKYNKKQLVLVEQAIYKDLCEQHKQCAKCHRTEGLTLDHIIARHVLTMFGLDVEREYIEGNYQLLCKPCNMFKSARLDFSTPKTKDILLDLLERV